MKINNIKNTFFYLTSVGVSIFLLFFFICCAWISYEVKDLCRDAKREYSGDCVESLSFLLKDEKRSFRTRNDAIWVLGQLGNRRALPVLESFYTGDIPEKEPLDRVISQYELKKALNLAGGGTNITAVFWRFGIDN